MIDGLIAGRMHARAEQRTSAKGTHFVTAKVRAAVAEGDSLFVNVITFSESAGAALLALDAGDSVALAGTLSPKPWTDREGNPRVALDMTAHQVLSAYMVNKRRTQSAPVAEPPPHNGADDWAHTQGAF